MDTFSDNSVSKELCRSSKYFHSIQNVKSHFNNWTIYSGSQSPSRSVFVTSPCSSSSTALTHREACGTRALKKPAVLAKNLCTTLNLKGKPWRTKKLLKSSHLSNETNNQAPTQRNTFLLVLPAEADGVWLSVEFDDTGGRKK